MKLISLFKFYHEDMVVKIIQKEEVLFTGKVSKVPEKLLKKNVYDIVLNPEEPIVINDENNDNEEIKKEPKAKEPETHEETYTEIIEPNNDTKDAKVINQRVINLNGGNYFEHVENLILKEDD